LTSANIAEFPRCPKANISFAICSGSNERRHVISNERDIPWRLAVEDIGRGVCIGHDPKLLVIRPAPPATSLDHLKPFKLNTALTN
jgi:hypothetical protein